MRHHRTPTLPCPRALATSTLLGALLCASASLAASPPVAPTFSRSKDRTVCLARKPQQRELPDLVWTGSRFAMTWYEMTTSTVAPKAAVLRTPPMDTAPPGGLPPGPPPGRPLPLAGPGRPPERAPLAPPRPGPPLPQEPPPESPPPLEVLQEPPPPLEAPRPARRAPPGRPQPILARPPNFEPERAPARFVSFAQKLAFVDESGEVLGGSTSRATPDDGASSVMGRLAFAGADLGLAYMDDGPGLRTATFARLDAAGKTRGAPFALSREFLPHGDHVAIAWNGTVEQWGVVHGGTFGSGNVTHHTFLERFRGDAPGTSLRLDEDLSTDLPGPNAALAPLGPCFVTTWTGYPRKQVMVAEVCPDTAVSRVELDAVADHQPMQATLAVSGARVLVAWVDRVENTPGLTSDVKVAVLERGKKGFLKVASRTFPKEGYAQMPHVVADAKGFWLSWDEGGQVWLAQLGLDGTPLGPETAVGATWVAPIWPRLVPGGKSLFVVVAEPNDPDCGAALVEVAKAVR